MTCPNCGHIYPISNGIPNMVRFSITNALSLSLSLTMPLSSLRSMRSRSKKSSLFYMHLRRRYGESNSLNLVDQVRSLSELYQKL